MWKDLLLWLKLTNFKTTDYKVKMWKWFIVRIWIAPELSCWWNKKKSFDSYWRRRLRGMKLWDELIPCLWLNSDAKWHGLEMPGYLIYFSKEWPPRNWHEGHWLAAQRRCPANISAHWFLQHAPFRWGWFSSETVEGWDRQLKKKILRFHRLTTASQATKLQMAQGSNLYIGFDLAVTSGSTSSADSETCCVPCQSIPVPPAHTCFIWISIDLSLIPWLIHYLSILRKPTDILSPWKHVSSLIKLPLCHLTSVVAWTTLVFRLEDEKSVCDEIGSYSSPNLNCNLQYLA